MGVEGEGKNQERWIVRQPRVPWKTLHMNTLGCLGPKSKFGKECMSVCMGWWCFWAIYAQLVGQLVGRSSRGRRVLWLGGCPALTAPPARRVCLLQAAWAWCWTAGGSVPTAAGCRQSRPRWRCGREAAVCASPSPAETQWKTLLKANRTTQVICLEFLLPSHQVHMEHNYPLLSLHTYTRDGVHKLQSVVSDTSSTIV